MEDSFGARCTQVIANRASFVPTNAVAGYSCQGPRSHAHMHAATRDAHHEINVRPTNHFHDPRTFERRSRAPIVYKNRIKVTHKSPTNFFHETTLLSKWVKGNCASSVSCVSCVNEPTEIKTRLNNPLFFCKSYFQASGASSSHGLFVKYFQYIA